MTDKARSLLQKMCDEFDRSKRRSFDSMFYMGYPDDVLEELSIYGYIIRKNDVIASIELTADGYAEGKR